MPVFGSVNLESGRLELGRRIRELRKERGWTLSNLASQLNISIAGLSAIETEKAVLDLDQLMRITGALQVPAESLLPRSQRRHFHIARRTDRERQEAAALKVVDQSAGTITAYHNLLRPLADPFVGKHIEPFYIEIQPVGDKDLQFICHHHEEFFFVLRGEVECLLKTPDGLIRQILAAGDCMYFWSFLPHCIRSTKPEAAAALHLLSAGHGAADSEHASGGSRETFYFTEAPNKSLSQQVAAKLSALRAARGMSGAELARELDVSLRTLTEIERGRKAIAIPLLLRMCDAFRKPLDYFLADTLVERPFHCVVRAAQLQQSRPRLRRTGQLTGQATDGMYRSLAEAFRHRGMHPFSAKLVRVDSEPQLREHHGQEFVYVLTGQITLHTILEKRRITETLSAGDSCFIDSTVPHRFVADGFEGYDNSAADVIIVYWCPLGEDYLFEAQDKSAGDPESMSSSSAPAVSQSV